MVDGQILEPFWFVNEEDGKPFNCDQQTYLEMLEEHFFPQLSARQIRKYWFQQDGRIKISICLILLLEPYFSIFKKAVQSCN